MGTMDYETLQKEIQEIGLKDLKEFVELLNRK